MANEQLGDGVHTGLGPHARRDAIALDQSAARSGSELVRNLRLLKEIAEVELAANRQAVRALCERRIPGVLEKLSVEQRDGLKTADFLDLLDRHLPGGTESRETAFSSGPVRLFQSPGTVGGVTTSFGGRRGMDPVGPGATIGETTQDLNAQQIRALIAENARLKADNETLQHRLLVQDSQRLTDTINHPAEASANHRLATDEQSLQRSNRRLTPTSVPDHANETRNGKLPLNNESPDYLDELSGRVAGSAAAATDTRHNDSGEIPPNSALPLPLDHATKHITQSVNAEPPDMASSEPAYLTALRCIGAGEYRWEILQRQVQDSRTMLVDLAPFTILHRVMLPEPTYLLGLNEAGRAELRARCNVDAPPGYLDRLVRHHGSPDIAYAVLWAMQHVHQADPFPTQAVASFRPALVTPDDGPIMVWSDVPALAEVIAFLQANNNRLSVITLKHDTTRAVETRFTQAAEDYPPTRELRLTSVSALMDSKLNAVDGSIWRTRRTLRS